MGQRISAEGANSPAPLPAINPATDSTISLSVGNGGSTRTPTALNTEKSNLYRFYSNVDWFMNKGNSSINSTTAKMPMKGGIDYYFVVDVGEFVAGITAAGSGTVFITPATKEN